MTKEYLEAFDAWFDGHAGRVLAEARFSDNTFVAVTCERDGDDFRVMLKHATAFEGSPDTVLAFFLRKDFLGVPGGAYGV